MDENALKGLFYKPEYPAEKKPELSAEAMSYAEGYKKFLDEGKTEREVAEYCRSLLVEAGYQPFDDRKKYQPGEKFYYIHRNKSVVCGTIGTRSLEDGFRLVIAHSDAPRLDLKPTPLYEKDHYSLFKTHYYGGIRKYQWTALPLAIHGIFFREDGTSVSVKLGEKEGDPVFCISDLLPHLGQEQNDRKLSEGVKGEELNILVGSEAAEAAGIKETVKLKTLILLNELYGITEKDFARAEIELVPAHKARDVGFDRAMVGAYGQDDRSNSYAAFTAELESQNPEFTSICVLSDKEEIGSEGVTGMQSMYAFHLMQQLCRSMGADDIRAFQNSKCLSTDVSAGYDPTWASAFEPNNGTYLGRGVAVLKYTGSRGKSGASDAGAELVSYVSGIFDAAGAAWQIGELGRIDLGGGGTIAKFVAHHGIDTLDVGVPVLSMHSPFELASKMDLYMAFKGFKAFLEAKN